MVIVLSAEPFSSVVLLLSKLKPGSENEVPLMETPPLKISTISGESVIPVKGCVLDGVAKYVPSSSCK